MDSKSNTTIEEEEKLNTQDPQSNFDIVQCGESVKVKQLHQDGDHEQQMHHEAQSGSKPKIDHKKMGTDLIINENDQEINFVGNRIGKLEGVEKCADLSVLCLRKNLIHKIEGLDKNVNLLELELYDNKITKIEGLEKLINLRLLDLSYNNIKKIEGLENLKKIEKLFLLSNKIKVIENLDFPVLTMLELGSNKISKIQNLDHLPSLVELYLGKNRISIIENLEPLKETLTTFALTANSINTIGKGLECMINLRELYIAENFISHIEGLSTLSELTLLDLSINKITKLEGIENLKKLTELWLNVNQIENFSDLDILVNNQQIETVYLSTNPVSRFPSYRQKLIEILPNISQIDATPLNVSYVVKTQKD